MAELTRDLLERPPEETSRLLAISFLDEAENALQRLNDPVDTEALHDFRVAVRRLRSSLRAYRPYLEGSLSKKMRRQLKELAQSTNQARDTEVQIDWLKPQMDGFSTLHQFGLRWLIDNLEARQTEEQASSLKKAAEEFTALRDKLTTKLKVCEIRLDTKESRQPSFLAVTGTLIEKLLSQLEKNLENIHSVGDHDPIHQSRISGKRLRYLLEPLRKEIPGARSLVKQLKALQDMLGELHDTKILEDEIAAALEKSAIEQARRLQEQAREGEPPNEVPRSGDDWRERHGLVELIRVLRERAKGLFVGLQAEYLSEKGREFCRSIRELGRNLGSHSGDIEPHRMYLLSRLPDRVKSGPSVSIDEGWLPGKNIPEVLRRIRSRGRVTHYRVLLTHDRRRRVEERIPRKLFETLWPLTEKRRLKRRCYEIFDDNLKWRVSQLADRDLILAEVEITPDCPEFSVPDWLTAHVRRDVTGVARYQGASLAAGRSRPRCR